jgi:hypothetical protein
LRGIYVARHVVVLEHVGRQYDVVELVALHLRDAPPMLAFFRLELHRSRGHRTPHADTPHAARHEHDINTVRREHPQFASTV